MHELAIRAPRLFDPGAYIRVRVEVANLLPSEPARLTMLRPTDNDVGCIRVQDADPIRPLAEANRVAHDVIIATGDQPGLFPGLAHRSPQGCSAITELRMSLGEAPDTRLLALEQQILRFSLTLRIDPRKDDACSNVSSILHLVRSTAYCQSAGSRCQLFDSPLRRVKQ